MIDYQALIKNTMLNLLREITKELTLIEAASFDTNCFLISFLTEHPGVILSKYLKKKYPHEMTIAIQHQFKDFKVDNEALYITLYFNGKPEFITIPYRAITSYADQEAEFTLNFDVSSFDDDKPLSSFEEECEKEPTDSNVIFLDQFRK